MSRKDEKEEPEFAEAVFFLVFCFFFLHLGYTSKLPSNWSLRKPGCCFHCAPREEKTRQSLVFVHSLISNVGWLSVPDSKFSPDGLSKKMFICRLAIMSMKSSGS